MCKGCAGLGNAEISPKSSAGVSCKRHPVNLKRGCACEALGFSSNSLGQAGTTALPISYRFSGLSAGTEQKLCTNFKYSFYMGITVLALRG